MLLSEQPQLCPSMDAQADLPLFQCKEQAAQNAPGTRMPCQAFTRKTKIIITSSWQSDCLSPQAFCHLAGHVLGSAKASPFGDEEVTQTAGRRHHSFRRWMHHEPLPDLWQAGDVENCRLIVSLDPISMPMRGSMPCWAGTAPPTSASRSQPRASEWFA